jgi:hypothetical protein
VLAADADVDAVTVVVAAAGALAVIGLAAGVAAPAGAAASRQPNQRIIATIIAKIRPINAAPNQLYAKATRATAPASTPNRADIAKTPSRLSVLSFIVFFSHGLRIVPAH